MALPRSLPRSERVRARADFVQAQRSADLKVRAHAFLIAVVVRPELPLARLGLVATKKLGGAVERNRAKRRVRALFRNGERPALPMDLIVILHADVLTAPFEELERQWARAMREVISRARKRPAGVARPANEAQARARR